MVLTPTQKDFVTQFLRVPNRKKSLLHKRTKEEKTDDRRKQQFETYRSREEKVLQAIRELAEVPGSDRLVAGFESTVRSAQERVQSATSENAEQVFKEANAMLDGVERDVHKSRKEREKLVETKRKEFEKAYEPLKKRYAVALLADKRLDGMDQLLGDLQAAHTGIEQEATSGDYVTAAALVTDFAIRLEAVEKRGAAEWEKVVQGPLGESERKLAQLELWKDADGATLRGARDAIGKLVQDRNYAAAIARFPEFQAAVEDKFAEKEQWYTGRVAADAIINKKLPELSKIEKSVADALQKQRRDIDAVVTRRDFVQALGDVRALQGTVTTVLAAFATHQAAMNGLGPEMGLAKNALADTALDFGDRKTEYQTAQQNIVTAKTLAGYTTLPALRSELRVKLDAVLQHYQQHGSTPEHDTWLEDRFAQVQLLGKSKLYKAVTVPTKSPALARLRQEFDVLLERVEMDQVPNPTLEDIKAWEAAIAKADQILAAREQVDKAEARLYKKYRPLEKQVEAALLTASGNPLQTAHAEFLDTLQRFRGFWDTDKNFAAAEQLLGELQTRTQTVLEPLISQAKQRVKNTGDLPEGNPLQKAEKGVKAREAINALSDIQLEALAPDEQIKLMKSLRVSDRMGEDPYREAQRKLYNTMKLDEAFLQDESQKRQQMTDKLLAEKQELLLQAKSTWNKQPQDSKERKALLEQKRKVLEEIVRAQCEAFGFDPPKKIEFVDEPDVLDNGAFQPDSKEISLNTNSVALNDFESAIDLIVHENHHNFQDQLVARLNLPENDPKKIKAPPPPNPLYQQALLFALNDEPSGYVTPDEGQENYEKQPMEEHSWYSGPKTAHGLVRRLNQI